MVGLQAILAARSFWPEGERTATCSSGEAGVTIGVDNLDNMFATRPGTNPAPLPISVGSQLDTQPTGGRHDGALGVLAALEINQTMNDLDLKTRHPVAVASWSNEEGSRIAPVMLGSGVFAGVHSPGIRGEPPRPDRPPLW